MVHARQGGEDALRFCGNKIWAAVRDPSPAWPGVGLPELSTPGVEVLGQLPVNRPQVIEVEPAWDRVLLQLHKPLAR